MKLYTKEKGLVADLNNELYYRLKNQYNFNIVIHEENLLSEEEYYNFKQSNLKYEKLDIDYSKVKEIKFELKYQYRYNGVTLSISTFDKKGEETYIDTEVIDEDNDFLITELVQSVSDYVGGSGDIIEWHKHLAPYFDLEKLKKYKIKLYDEEAVTYFSIDDEKYVLTTGEGSDS
jgi:hypothetical protein